MSQATALIVLVLMMLVPQKGEAGPQESGHGKNIVQDLTDPPNTTIYLTPELSAGARLDVEYNYEANYDLDKSVPDDLSVISPTLILAFTYTPTEYFMAYINFESTQRIVDDDEHKKDDESKIELKQAYVSFENFIEGLKLSVGRQRIKDSREWIYDEELDAIRLTYGFDRGGLDFSVSQNNYKDLVNEGNDEDATFVMLYGTYEVNPDLTVAAYGFIRDDTGANEESPIFYGLRAEGDISEQFNYWVDMAHVRGRGAGQKIRGYGFDVGGTFWWDVPTEPSLTFSYAFGSGDDDASDQTDGNFRQTGLQDNDAKFHGITRIKYYGELFDPELSNMTIVTAGIGVRPTKKSSLDILYHYYHQNHSVASLRDVDIDRSPTGLDDELGHEIDIVTGIKINSHLKASVVFGWFMPGSAFSRDVDDAFFVEIKTGYTF